MGIIKNYKEWNKLFEDVTKKIKNIKYVNLFKVDAGLLGQKWEFKVDDLGNILTRNMPESNKKINVAELISGMSPEKQKKIPGAIKSDDKEMMGATGPQLIRNILRSPAGANAIIRTVLNQNSGLTGETATSFTSIPREKIMAEEWVKDAIFGPAEGTSDYDPDDVMEFKVGISNLSVKEKKAQGEQFEEDGEDRKKTNAIFKLSLNLTIDHPIINATSADGSPRTFIIEDAKLAISIWPAGEDKNLLGWEIISMGIKFVAPVIQGASVSCEYFDSTDPLLAAK
jgi:hypothetical protein